MTEIGSRGKIGTGHGKLGSRSGCVISERRNTYPSAKTDHILNWLRRAIANTNQANSHRRTAFKEIPMECQRCLLGKEAKYRVYTDLIDMKVCETCAEEARRLGIAVEALDDGKVKNNGTVCGSFASV
jgi:hypothetical protein